MTAPVLLDVTNGVATICLNRPERGNAIDAATARSFLEIVARCGDDPEVRCIVITGSGKIFCGGGDVQAFVAAGDGVGALVETITTPLHDAIARLSLMPKPIITMINGAVAGAGLGLAMIGDVAVAALSATFTAGYGRLGVTPDAGVTWLLPKLVGMRKAQQMLVSLDQIDAQEAKSIGLVTHAIEDASLHSFTLALAARLKQRSGTAVRMTRELMYLGYRSGLAEHLGKEALWIGETVASQDGREGARAFVEKRRPVFES